MPTHSPWRLNLKIQNSHSTFIKKLWYVLILNISDYKINTLNFQQRTLSCGTTTACYFATIHKKSSEILADEAHAQGQRAFIGKVAMNQYSPDHYV